MRRYLREDTLPIADGRDGLTELVRHLLDAVEESLSHSCESLLSCGDVGLEELNLAHGCEGERRIGSWDEYALTLM